MNISGKRWLIYGVILGVGVLGVVWLRGVHRRAMIYSGEAPSLAALESVESEGDAGLRNIEELWNEGMLPQRLHVIETIRRRCYRRDPETLKRLRPIVLKALFDVDQGIQKHALKIVQSVYPDDLPRVLPLLSDPDSLTRDHALRALIRAGDARCVWHVLPLLDDPDPEVRILAATALRRWTEDDNGVRFNASETSVEEGLDQWRRWRKENGEAYRKSAVVPKSTDASRPIPAAEFSLTDLEGKSFDPFTSDHRVVMLYFWGKDDLGKIASMDHLKDVQMAFPDTLRIVPIAVDAVPQVHVGHEDETHCGHADGEHDHDQAGSGGKRAVAAAWRRHGFQERCFIDDGSASFRYNSNEVPTTVLIADGVVRRRFTGNRSPREIQAMIDLIVK